MSEATCETALRGWFCPDSSRAVRVGRLHGCGRHDVVVSRHLPDVQEREAASPHAANRLPHHGPSLMRSQIEYYVVARL